MGTIAFLLFFLPILSLPISAFGVFFGLLATILAVFAGRADLRWSLLGLTVSLLALYFSSWPLFMRPGRLFVAGLSLSFMSVSGRSICLFWINS